MSNLERIREEYLAALDVAVRTQDALASEVSKIARMLDAEGCPDLGDVFGAVAQNLRAHTIENQAQANALRE